MLKNRLSFNLALFGVAFVICVIGAMLILPNGANTSSDDDGMIADGTALVSAKHSSSASPAASATPLPEMVNASATPLPATPAARQPDNLATAGPAVEADVENPSAALPDVGSSAATAADADAPPPEETLDKAMDIYAARSAASAASRPTEELPVASQEKPEIMASSPQMNIATSNEDLSPKDADRLRELPKGFIIDNDSIRPVQKIDATPDTGSVEVADISGQQQPITQERVEELLRKYRADDLPAATSTPPPIAVPDAFRPKAFTPTPTPGILSRMRGVPKNLITTPPPSARGVQTNDATQPPPTDAGSAPVTGLFEDPAVRSKRRLDEALAQAAVSPEPSADMAVSQPATAFDPTAVQGPATPVSFSVKKGKAQVSFSNVPPGWVRSDTNVPVPPPPAAPGAVPTPMTNAGAAPSPTPNFDTGIENAKAAISKYNLPPAPTLPPKVMEPDTKKTPPSAPGEPTPESAPETEPPAGKTESQNAVPTPSSSLHQRLDKASLPPEIAERLAKNPAQAASVGDRVLTRAELQKHVQASMDGKGQKSLSEDDRVLLENVVAEEWAELTALAEEARRKGLSVSDDEVREFKSRQEQRQGMDVDPLLRKAGFTEQEIMDRMKDSALCEKLINSAFEKEYDDAKLKAIYESAPGQFQLSRRLRVQEIYKSARPGQPASAETEQRMRQLQREVSRGQDFAQIATQESESGTRDKGGDMGWIDAESRISPEVLKALAELRPGKVSDVIPCKDGYRIVKLVEVQDPKQSFDEARGMVERRVKESLRETALEAAKSEFVVKVGTRQLLSRAERAKRAAANRKSANIAPSSSGFQNSRVTVRGARQIDSMPSTKRVPDQEFTRSASPKGFR